MPNPYKHNWVVPEEHQSIPQPLEQGCLHDALEEQYKDSLIKPIHMISCPCKKCNPFSL